MDERINGAGDKVKKIETKVKKKGGIKNAKRMRTTLTLCILYVVLLKIPCLINNDEC